MALQLPANFAKDIEGRDTALFPVVGITIGFEDFLWLSTNDHKFDSFVGTTPFCLPLLLNIPSLKESLDIEKRNYKISNITLNISNYPYQGKRFSDLITDSLMNAECRVYWVSPSVTGITLNDMWFVTPDDFHAFEVYYGTVRRYNMTDEIITLAIEDRSQATLHKDLPLPDNWLGSGDTVPDKYKNKLIPMAYGHVHRSPLVLRGYDDQRLEIIPDNDNSGTSFIANSNPLLIEENGSYANVLEESINYEHYGYEELNQYQKITADNGTESILFDKQILPNSENQPPTWNLLLDNKAEVFFESVNPVKRVYNISDNPDPFNSSGGVIADYPDSIINHIYDDQNALSGAVMLGWQTEPSAVFNGIIYPDFITINKYFLHIDFTPEGLPHKSDDSEALSIINSTWSWALGEFLYNFGSEYLHAQYVRIWTNLTKDIRNSAVDSDNNGLMLIDNNVSLYGADGTGSIYFTDSGNIEHEYEWTDGIPSISFRAGIFPFLAYLDSSTQEGLSAIGQSFSFNLNNFNFITYYFVDGFNKLDFFADVYGRAMQDDGTVSPTMPQAIENLLKNELLPDIDITISPEPNYSVFKYAFTIDSKINSKKLIEGLSSASPYISRFTNMGDFKFDVIPPNGGIAQHTIYEADVIDFNFSRTKIEEVKTKVELKYKWDYARGEFSKSIGGKDDEYPIVVDDLFPNYETEFYGLKEIDGDIHAESTLVIDDDRGRYIRESSPAESLAHWLLSWHCNQHLKIKVRMPLKYMKLEISDLIEFDKILGGVKPYGISYNKNSTGQQVNGQPVFPTFMITSTNKTLKWVEIECIQMHKLTLEGCDGWDCLGNCIGESGFIGDTGDLDAEGFDECGVCNGNGIADGACDCDGNVLDALFICGGSCLDDEDEDGVCDDVDPCVGSLDCAGICNGGATLDECGVCGGSGIPDGFCDCEGNTMGCDNVCGSGLWWDDCGVCGGDNSSCSDCAGVPNGDSIMDICGDCVSPDNVGEGCDDCLEDEGLPCGTPTEVGGEGCHGYDICNGGQTFYAGVPEGEGACEEVTNLNDCADTYPNWSPPQLPMQIHLQPFPNRGYGTSSSSTDIVQALINPADLIIFGSGGGLEDGDGGDWEGDAQEGFTGNYYKLPSTVFNLNVIDSQLLDNIPSGSVHSLQYKLEYDSSAGQHPMGGDLIICGGVTGGGCPGSLNIPLDEWIDYGTLNSDDWSSSSVIDLWSGDGNYLFALSKENLDNYFIEDSHYWIKFNLLLKIVASTQLDDGSVHDFEYEQEYAYKIIISDCIQLGDMNGDGNHNVLDIVALANCVLGAYTPDGVSCDEIEHGCAADMNGDGEYNVLDIVLLANCVLAESCGGD